MDGNKDDYRPRPLHYHLQPEQLAQALPDLPDVFPYDSLYIEITLQLGGTGKPSEARRLSTHYHRGVSALLIGSWSSRVGRKTFLAFSLLFLVSRSLQPCTEPSPKLLPYPFKG